MPKVTVNEATFYYELNGKGPPLVIVCGYTQDSRFSVPFVQELSKTFQVLTFDNRGVGQTEDDGRKLSAELMADDTFALIEELKLEKPHMIGISMGGTIVQSFASRYQDSLSKLIIHVSTAKWRRAMRDGLESMLRLREMGLEFDVIFNSTLPWIYGERILQDESKREEMKNLILSNPFPQSALNQRRQFQVLTDFDGRASLSSIKAPTLVSYATEDLLSLPYEANFLKEQISRAELCEWSGGHNLFFDFPEKLAQRFLEFFLK